MRTSSLWMSLAALALSVVGCANTPRSSAKSPEGVEIRKGAGLRVGDSRGVTRPTSSPLPKELPSALPEELPSAGAGDVILLRHRDNHRIITVRLGTSLVIRLPVKDRKGFEWELGRLEGKVLTAVFCKFETGGKGHVYDKARGTATFVVRATAGGKGRLRIHYLHPFRKPRKVLKTFSLVVEVAVPGAEDTRGR